LSNFKNSLVQHFKENILMYLIVFFFLVSGIIIGSIAVKALDSIQKENLINYLTIFFKNTDINEIDESTAFKQALLSNIKISLLIWILGVTVIGIPLILLLIAFRGFVLGFTVAFLVDELGLKGIIFSILALLPQNIVNIPVIIILGVTAISFSLLLFRRKRQINLFQVFLCYIVIGIFLNAFFLVGSLIEAYITPVFMKLIIPHL